MSSECQCYYFNSRVFFLRFIVVIIVNAVSKQPFNCVVIVFVFTFRCAYVVIDRVRQSSITEFVFILDLNFPIVFVLVNLCPILLVLIKVSVIYINRFLKTILSRPFVSMSTGDTHLHRCQLVCCSLHSA